MANEVFGAFGPARRVRLVARDLCSGVGRALNKGALYDAVAMKKVPESVSVVHMLLSEDHITARLVETLSAGHSLAERLLPLYIDW